MDSFGARLRRVLDALGYSQKEFCELANLNKNTLSQIMNNKVTPEQMTKQRIYNAVPGLNPKWLEHGVGEMGQIGNSSKSYSDLSRSPSLQIASDIKGVYSTADEIKVSVTDLFASYYAEVELISQLLTNKQAGWKSIIESLKK